MGGDGEAGLARLHQHCQQATPNISHYQFTVSRAGRWAYLASCRPRKGVYSIGVVRWMITPVSFAQKNWHSALMERIKNEFFINKNRCPYKIYCRILLLHRGPPPHEGQLLELRLLFLSV